MAITPELISDLEQDEGLELEAYPDPLSPLGTACKGLGLPMHNYRHVPNWQALSGHPWTIGYGHTGAEVHQGLIWTKAQAQQVLSQDAQSHADTLVSAIAWVTGLDQVRQDVLYNMVFNLGVTKLLGFKNTLAAIKSGDYVSGANGMLASAWAHQVGARATRLAAMMKSGHR